MCGIGVDETSSSLRPMIGTSFGADGQLLCSTSVQPTLHVHKCEHRDLSYARENEYLRRVFLVVENALLIALDKDLETSIDEFFGVSGRERRTTLEFLLFAAEPQLLDHF